MSHLHLDTVESESSSIFSHGGDEEEDSIQEMPLKLVKREIETTSGEESFNEFEEEEVQKPKQQQQSQQERIIVNRPVMYSSSLLPTRQVNELSL